jgi:aryl-alcohol dehydrogenase
MPFAMRQMSIPQSRPDEILVRIRAAGICGSGLHAAGENHMAPLPLLLGHECAGEIARVGKAVTGFCVGDRVCLSSGSRGRCDGPASAAFFGQPSFPVFALTSPRNLVRLPDDLPFELAAPLGCCIQGGASAVLRTLAPGPGQSLVVFGARAVGMSAVMAAALCGTDPVVVVEPSGARRSLALDLGATDAVDTSPDIAGRIQAVVGAADFAIDTTGRPDVMRCALEVLTPGGTLALSGTAPRGTTFEMDLMELLISRFARGLVVRSAVPRIFWPMIIRYWRRGCFPLERIIRTYPFTDIERAIDDMRTGVTIKPVVVV